jgi:hypothetical protein
MTVPEYTPAGSPSTPAPAGNAAPPSARAIVRAGYQELVSELTELPQDKFDQRDLSTRPTVRVVVRIVR